MTSPTPEPLDVAELRRLYEELPAELIPADVWRVGRAVLPMLPAILDALDAQEARCVGCGRLPSEGVGCSSCPGYNLQGYPEEARRDG